MNGNKRINNLKRLVIIISVAILIVGVILIMSIYNNKYGKIGGSSEGGMSTVPTTTSTDIIIDPDGDETTTTTAAGEETTTTSPVTTASTKTNKTNIKTQAPTGGSQVVTQAPSKYTIITTGGSGYANSVNALEWATVEQINKLRGDNKLQVAQELRATAETAANNAVDSLIASEHEENGCSQRNVQACRCDYGNLNFNGAAYCANYVGSIEEVVKVLVNKKPDILSADAKYIGVGVIQKNKDRYSYVVIVD